MKTDESEGNPMKLRISNESDRITVAGILFKNSYAVQQVKAKEGKKTVTYLEYEMGIRKGESDE